MSIRLSVLVVAGLGLGCARGSGTAPPSAPAPSAESSTEASTDGAAPTDAEAAGPAQPKTTSEAMADPAVLYEECKDRVEGRQTAGECTSDADCVKAGCSGEVCVPADLAAGMMTTCEVRPCFAALDTCGCHDGQCTWALKDGPVPALPGGGKPIALPPQ